METLHLISVRETAAADVKASGAKLSVRIDGQSFFTGNEAFKKAEEVANLVAALKDLGLTSDDIELTNVSAGVESGLLLKTSSVTYHLVIHCESTDLLGKVLATISSQKNIWIGAINWQYPDLENTRRSLLQDAARSAKETARTIAESINCDLIGIHQLSYEFAGTRAADPMIGAAGDMTMRGRSKAKTAALESLELSHCTTVSVNMTAEFMVGSFVSGSPAT